MEVLIHARRHGLLVLIGDVFAYHLRINEAITANAAMPLVAGEHIRTPLGAFRVVFGIGHFDNQINFEGLRYGPHSPKTGRPPAPEVLKAPTLLLLARIRSRLRWSWSKVKLLDGYALGSLAIGRFDRAEIFAAATHDDDAPTLGGLFGMGTPGHTGKIVAAGRASESVVCQRAK
jgi:hypothetical protein